MTPALLWEDLRFSYADEGGVARPVLRGATATVAPGAFCLLTGAAGSGKSTLLRLCKPELAPAGACQGRVRVLGQDPARWTPRESAQTCGFVLQDPEAQGVATDVVHELAFCLENLGSPPAQTLRRVAECASFFGIDAWASRPLAQLSGGQRQLVEVAAAMVSAPSVLLLDEPTASLDPVAEQRLLAGLFRLNRELGVTVVVATHRPGPMAPYATCALRLEDGRLREVPPDQAALPAEPLAPAPVWDREAPAALAVRDAWASYGRSEPWVLRGLDLELRAGEVRALVGGNGAGKSTLLRLCAGTLRPRRGRVLNPVRREQAYWPQRPGELLSQETVGRELLQWAPPGDPGRREARQIAAFLGLEGLWERDPWDLSEGQRQLVCLARVALARPRLLLADEPTRSLDGASRSQVSRVVAALAAQGAAVLCATHDLAFARDACATTSLLFDGRVVCTEDSPAFFEHNLFWRP